MVNSNGWQWLIMANNSSWRLILRGSLPSDQPCGRGSSEVGHSSFHSWRHLHQLLTGNKKKSQGDTTASAGLWRVFKSVWWSHNKGYSHLWIGWHIHLVGCCTGRVFVYCIIDGQWMVDELLSSTGRPFPTYKHIHEFGIYYCWKYYVY